MKTLADEWKKRDKERELMMKRKVCECDREGLDLCAYVYVSVSRN